MNSCPWCQNWNKFPCCSVDKEILYWLAALVWLVGVLATGETGTNLLVDAQRRYDNKDMWIVYTCWALSVAVGLTFAHLLFVPIFKKNLVRILALEDPRIYQFFRMRFWFMLIFFDGSIYLVTKLFAKDELSHALIGALDFSVCVSLSVSGFLYFTEWKSFRQKCIEARIDLNGTGLVGVEKKLITDANSSSLSTEGSFPDTL